MHDMNYINITFNSLLAHIVQYVEQCTTHTGPSIYFTCIAIFIYKLRLIFYRLL